jgi:threonine aldolase
MKTIDLRSDTVTHPTPEMRQAMANAPVGDDVYGEDPTVNKLEQMAASLMGKESALFVPSGTMGNTASVLAQCGRGDEVILGSKAHTFLFEAGSISALGGIHSHQLPNQADGSIRLDDIKSAIRPDNAHYPVTRLICLENTHNRCGGTYQSTSYTQSVVKLAHANNIKVHLDGARIFNAAAALGVEPRELAAPIDSLTFCLSKGLCAPVGSLICGSQDFIHSAHRIRKQLGGGMRQAGIIAAAGIVALEKMTERLHEDHLRAKKLADGLRTISGVVLEEGTPATNMVFLSLSDHIEKNAQQVSDQLSKKGILVGATGERSFRLVTHYWIDDPGIEHAVEMFGQVVR